MNKSCTTCKHYDLPCTEDPCKSCTEHAFWTPEDDQVISAIVPDPVAVNAEICLGKPEMVNHPAHYNQHSIEPIDVIEDWGLNFNLGSTVKYIARCDYKEQPIQDLEKAAWYLNREIERRKKEA